jgi:hypothetical protein
MIKWITFALILFLSCNFGRILEHFVNFLKWPEKKFEVIFRSIFRPLFLYLLEILDVPSILQQIQISVDQPYTGPGSLLLRYQRDI